MKPLLSSPVDFAKVTWPKLCSPKLDGIRALIVDGVVVSRKLIPIPCPHVQDLFGKQEYNGLDGELIVGPPNAPDVYNRTQEVMRKTGWPDVTFHVFDDFTEKALPFNQRWIKAQSRLGSRMVLVPQTTVDGEESAKALYTGHLDDGYEGLMLRSPLAYYKEGRSTVNEGILLKWKPLVDSEAEVLSCFEQMHNTNEAKLDELGHTKRSSHASGLVGKDTLGGFVARDIHTGIEFNVGIFTGVTDAGRKELWLQRETLKGKIFKYSSLQIGVKEKPRHPRYIGWRDPIDIVL